MPTVAAQLGGLDLYAWTFSAYLLSSTVAIPIYGRLADVYGRKATFLVATSLFVVGSALCAGAQSMPQLIAARFVQGFGGGGLYPLTLTIVGDAFDLEDRARLLGLLAAVWGVSAVIGPAIGGFVTEQLSWRWAFVVQLPLALLAMLLMARFLREPSTRAAAAPRGFDALGAVLLSTAVAALLFGIQASASPAIGLSAVGIALVFVLHERRAAQPLLPLGVFRIRAVAAGALTCLMLGVVLFGQASFVPPLLQGVLGASPTAAGLTLSATSIGWPFAANLCGPLVIRYGYRATGVLGTGLLVCGFIALREVGPGTSLPFAALMLMILGAGFGFISPVALLSMQNAVGWTERGVVTGVNQFATNLGGTLGVALAGALFADGLRTGAPLSLALAPVFWLLLGVAVAGLGLAAWLPGGRAT